MKKIEDLILFQIEQTSKVAKQHSQREMDRMNVGVTVEQWILLKIISESTDLTQRELAKKSSRDPGSITRTLDLLQKKEYVMRTVIPNNRRGYYIELTKAGAAFIATHMPFIQQQRDKSIAGFSTEELNQLSAYLKRIQNNMG